MRDFWMPGRCGESVQMVVMDVSFISATLVLPAVVRAAFAGEDRRHELVVLVKPQFEVGREKVGKGGIVRDEKAQQGGGRKGEGSGRKLGGTDIDVIDSPILGAEGNKEFLLHAIW